jgi:lambda repressor-like predicted transcriptional regulator
MKFNEEYRDIRIGQGEFAFVPGPTDNKVLCAQVFEVCKSRGWSLLEVSRAMGISQSSLSRVMHGKWVGDELKTRVAACFGCSVREMFP